MLLLGSPTQNPLDVVDNLGRILNGRPKFRPADLELRFCEFHPADLVKDPTTEIKTKKIPLKDIAKMGYGFSVLDAFLHQ